MPTQSPGFERLLDQACKLVESLMSPRPAEPAIEAPTRTHGVLIEMEGGGIHPDILHALLPKAGISFGQAPLDAATPWYHPLGTEGYSRISLSGSNPEALAEATEKLMLSLQNLHPTLKATAHRHAFETTVTITRPGNSKTWPLTGQGLPSPHAVRKKAAFVKKIPELSSEKMVVVVSDDISGTGAQALAHWLTWHTGAHPHVGDRQRTGLEFFLSSERLSIQKTQEQAAYKPSPRKTQRV